MNRNCDWQNPEITQIGREPVLPLGVTTCSPSS